MQLTKILIHVVLSEYLKPGSLSNTKPNQQALQTIDQSSDNHISILGWKFKCHKIDYIKDQMPEPKITFISQPAIEIKPQTYEYLNKTYQSITKGFWKEHNMKQIVKHIEKWDAEDFFLSTWIMNADDDQDRILKQIENISFSKLTRLNLWKNAIRSIECISFIWLPSLQKLNIDDNQILRTKPMRKMNCSSLKMIQISNNPISDAQLLSQVHTRKQLQLISIEYSNDPPINCRSGVAAKMEATSLGLIRFAAKKRIKEQRVYASIRKKYSPINLQINSSEDLD